MEWREGEYQRVGKVTPDDEVLGVSEGMEDKREMVDIILV